MYFRMDHARSPNAYLTRGKHLEIPSQFAEFSFNNATMRFNTQRPPHYPYFTLFFSNFRTDYFEMSVLLQRSSLYIKQITFCLPVFLHV
jgi:hypothetical protein